MLKCRPPVEKDLVALCRELNQRGARYVDVGGFAIASAGYARYTGDVDLIVAVDAENEAKVYSALSTLPDNALREADGAPIPFASPRLLWRMKAVTHRAKDAGDLVFLRQWFAGRGEEPPRM